ncbi:MAG: hypothetical protein DRO23_04805 [Thermoprotei archaeon]|nr:MAG: hypothetical protein DRO23_04805 [Thermoprotei archaeon]
MVSYHYIDAIITFILLSLSMITGILTLLVKNLKVRRTILILHIIFSMLAFIAFVITFLRAPKI